MAKASQSVFDRCAVETRDGRCKFEAGHLGNCVLTPNRAYMERSQATRLGELRVKWQDLQNDVARWNATHPDEEPIVIEPITQAEIEALRRG